MIFPERYEEWEKIVIASANGLYHGNELNAALDIMQAIETGATIDEAKSMLDSQGHSGLTESIIRDILLTFSSKGPEFWEATNYSEISPENQKLLEEKKQENIELAKIYSQKNFGPKL